ncbi:MAG: hypothetical protein ABIH34_02025 [Nanoarchaeota archaeon]
MRKFVLSVLVIACALALMTGCTITGEAKGGGSGIPKPQCSDRMDNDGDGYCDFLTSKTRCIDGSIPGDVDCASADDNQEEADCVPQPEVCDGHDNDCDSQIDENLPIACSSASDCGESGWTGDAYCGEDDNSHRDWITYQCNFPATCSAICTSQVVDYIYDWCSNGCENGACLPNATHLACQNEQCIMIQGSGSDECQYDTDCVVIPPSCTDSDGYDVFTYGYVNGDLGGGSPYTYWDSCWSASTVKEWTCSGPVPQNNLTFCNYGCAGGVCAQSNQTGNNS